MKKILKITTLSGLLTILKMVIGFILSKAAAVYAGPGGVVALGQMQSLIASLNGIVNAPVSTGVIRYTAEYKDIDCSRWWRASLCLLLILSVIIILMGGGFARELSLKTFGREDYQWLVYIILAILPLTAIGTFLTSILNGLELYKKYIISGAVSSIISSIFTIYLIISFKLEGALIAAAIQGGIVGITMLIVTSNLPWFKLKRFIGYFDKQSFFDICKFFCMAVASALLFPLTIMAIRFILVNEVGLRDSGNWQAVWRVSEAYLSIITMALSTYYLPRISSLIFLTDIRKEIKNTLKIVIPLVILMAIGIYVLRDFVVLTLYTKEFYLSRDLFSVQLLGDVVKIISWLYAYPVLVKGNAKIFISCELFFSLSFIAMTYCLVLVYGVHGANYAYLINYILYLLCMRYILTKMIK